MPLEFPSIGVTFKNILSAEETESLKSRGAAVLANKDAAHVKYTFGAKDVSMDLLSFLYKHTKKAEAKCAVPVGSVNLAVVQSYFKVNAIFTWFLKTQSYPAFSGPTKIIEDEHQYNTIEGFVTMKRHIIQKEGSSKKPRLEGIPEGSDEEEDMAVDEQTVAIDEMMFGDEVSKIPKAKPSTAPEYPFGPSANMPTLPGLSFPYFDGMLDTDTAFVSSVIKEFFLESLGDTREEILGGYKDLKLHMGLLASTKPGKALQHIALGIRLAIQAQARCYPIFAEERYVGFTIHGYYFSLSIDGYRHVPKSTEELAKDVASIDEHNVALAKILEKLSKLKLETTGKAMAKKTLKDKKADCKNPRKLAALIGEFKMTPEDRDEIEKLATNLSFPQRFWTIDEKNILKAIDYLVAETFPDDDVPLYPRGGCLTTSDFRLSVFAAFGDQAFSLRLSGGSPQKVPVDAASDTLFKPYKGRNNKEVIPKPNIIVAKKGLSLCLEDWSAFYGDHVVYTKQTRDAMFRSVVFGGERAKTLWFGLIARIGPLTIDDTRKVKAADVALGDEAEGSAVDDFSAFL